MGVDLPTASETRQRRRYQLRSPSMYDLPRRVWMYARVPDGLAAEPLDWKHFVGDPAADLELLGLAIDDARQEIRVALTRPFGRRRAVLEALAHLEHERDLIALTTGRAP